MTLPATADFWDWSLDRYADAGVADLLLHLQDDLVLNVNMLLWCGWCAESFSDVTDLCLRKAIDLTEHWSKDVTRALRHARRALKNPPRQADPEAAEALRQDIKSLELRAERAEQSMLDRLARENLTAFPDAAGALPRARRNLTRYAALAGAVRKQGFSTLLLDDLSVRMFPYADSRYAGGREPMQA